ncbi:hypothetical protein D9M70_616660 [compost metagenome]
MKGCMGSTVAPAFSNRRAACSTAAWISGSTARPQPASSSSPMRRPRRWSGATSNAAQSMSCAGRLMLSRASGRASACIMSAASPTVRVMGPAARPM